MRPILACGLALLGLATTLPAQPAQRPRCDAAEHRQFDFWLGDWEVLDADGNPQGTNRIDAILDGCVLQENWQGAGGSVGHSFNVYDRTTGRWHQTWVDNAGTLLRIDGGLEDGAMVLRGSGIARDGGEVLHSITWTPLDDGRVKQHWQISRDGGETWTDAFVGFYTRSEPAA